MTIEKVQRTSNSRHRKQICTATILAALAVAAYIVTISMQSYNRTWWSYKFRQDRLATIVDRIKVETTDIGTHRLFQVDQALNPSSLKPLDRQSDQHAICKLSAFQREKGDYLIEFVLDDRGHFGLTGLLYSDSKVEYSSLPGSSITREDAYYLHRISRQIDSRWSFAYDDLE